MNSQVIVLLLGPVDHDSRVLKTLDTVRSELPTTLVCHGHSRRVPDAVSVHHRVRRLVIPGLSALLMKGKFVIAARHAARTGDVICWCNDLPGLQVGVALRLLLGRRVRLVYDSHEFAINDRPGESRARIFLKWLAETACIRFAEKVICVSPRIAEEYVRLYGIPRPSLVMNCPPWIPTPPRSDLIRRALGLGADQRVFLYQGGLARGRGIEMIMSAFEARADDAAVAVFMGQGPLEREIRDRAAACKGIRFLPAVPPPELLEWTASADFGLCFTEDSCLTNRWCLPNKLFEYVMAGIPVIASNTPEVARFISATRAGTVVASNTSEALRTMVDDLVVHGLALDPRRQDVTRRRFCWERQADTIMSLLKSMAEPTAAVGSGST